MAPLRVPPFLDGLREELSIIFFSIIIIKEIKISIVILIIQIEAEIHICLILDE